ncbi:hypothetical protein EVAR_36417_1 [Eumeta japonica]|uniref:Uncharacterized protein n=1 Tax=Eumeta variegata TaxID=151549 RepID=A0A4C1VPU2_EUMVA|nr:hypothetical protein EVAR_36417_1 [Eumeta japonica]
MARAPYLHSVRGLHKPLCVLRSRYAISYAERSYVGNGKLWNFGCSKLNHNVPAPAPHRPRAGPGRVVSQPFFPPYVMWKLLYPDKNGTEEGSRFKTIVSQLLNVKPSTLAKDGLRVAE